MEPYGRRSKFIAHLHPSSCPVCYGPGGSDPKAARERRQRESAAIVEGLAEFAEERAEGSDADL